MPVRPTKTPFTGNADADQLLTDNPLALILGMLLDQQVPMEWAFGAPALLRERLGGTLDAPTIAKMTPEDLEAIFRAKPALHRYPGNMAKRVQELCALVASEYGGDASRLWSEARDADDLERRIRVLPGFGDMKVKALGSVLAKRLGVAAAEPLVPPHPTLGDVDSVEALEAYQAAKRAHKRALRADTAAS